MTDQEPIEPPWPMCKCGHDITEHDDPDHTGMIFCRVKGCRCSDFEQAAESYASQFAKAYPPGAVIDFTDEKWAEPRDGRRRTW